MFAQRTVVQIPILTVEDSLQDQDIKELNKHLESTDAKLDKAVDAINKSNDAIAGMKGEERAVGLLLGLLEIGAIIVQIKKQD